MDKQELIYTNFSGTSKLYRTYDPHVAIIKKIDKDPEAGAEERQVFILTEEEWRTIGTRMGWKMNL